MKEIYLYKKNNTKNRTINVGLSYPSTYYYGMSVLGFLSLFKDFDRNECVSAQRIFLNSKSLAFAPKSLDLLGFSCVFELDVLQILKILKKYGFHIESQKRKRKMPLIFAGGPVITNNPEPFADFFDFLILGDAEGIADEIIKVYQNNKKKSKFEILKALSKIEGIYVPALYNVKYEDNKILTFYPIDDTIPAFVKKRTSVSEKCLYSPIITDNSYYSNTVFIELSRGCPCNCSFCTACWQNKPTRYFDIKHIKKTIKKAIKYANKIVFIGAMITAHPDFNKICIYLKKLKEKKDFEIEFSSLSFDYLSDILPEIINEKKISLAIECANEQLRYKMGKNLTNQKIQEVIYFYTQRGINKINLYFLIGLPDETKDIIDEYIEFSRELKNKYVNVEFTHIISTFIPKPNTPLENEARKSNAILENALTKIKTEFDKNSINCILPQIKIDNFNALISLGDRRISPYIQHILKKNIPANDLIKEYNKFTHNYNKKLSSDNKLPHFSYYLYQKKDEDTFLAWNFIKF